MSAEVRSVIGRAHQFFVAVAQPPQISSALDVILLLVGIVSCECIINASRLERIPERVCRCDCRRRMAGQCPSNRRAFADGRKAITGETAAVVSLILVCQQWLAKC